MIFGLAITVLIIFVLLHVLDKVKFKELHEAGKQFSGPPPLPVFGSAHEFVFKDSKGAAYNLVINY